MKQERITWKINPILPVLGVPLILFGGMLIKGQVLFWGTPSLQFFPWWDFAWSRLLSGEIPLWNPLSGMGAPLIANYQTALFYPPYWVGFIAYLVGGTAWMAWAHTLLVMGHLMAAGIGMMRLLKRLQLNTLAQMIGGLCYGAGGYLVSRAGFLSINAATTWFPWVLLTVTRLIEEQKWDRTIPAGLSYGLLFLAGHAQTAWYVVLFSVCWMIWWSWVDAEEDGFNSRVRRLLKHASRFAAAGLIGIGIAAVQLLPTLEYLLQSQRSSEVGYEAAMTYSFWPWRFLTLLAPDLFGTPAAGNYWGYGNYWEDAVYIGLLPLILAGIVIIKMGLPGRKADHIRPRGRKHQKLVRFSGIMVGVSFLLALGKNTPVFPFLYRHVPTFDLFQAPTRFSIWAQLSLALAAAVGAHQWTRPENRRLYWTRLAAAGCVAVAAGAGAAWLLLGEIRATFIQAAAAAGLFGLLAAVLALTKPEECSQVKKMGWLGAVIVVVCADLIRAGWGLNPGIDRSFYTAEYGNEWVENRLYMPPDLEYEIKFEDYFRFDTFHPDKAWLKLRQTSLPNLHLLDRNRSVNNFDPILPGRYQRWMDALNETEFERKKQLYGLMGVGTILQRGEKGEIIYHSSGIGDWLPVQLVSCASFVESDEAALKAVFEGDLDLERVLIIEDKQTEQHLSCREGTAQIELLYQSGRKLRVHLEADQPGYVFWSQVWYPGWTWRIDGEPAEVLRVNYLFQGAAVDQGEHILQMEYRPISFRIGAGTSLMMALIVGAGLWSKKRSTEK